MQEQELRAIIWPLLNPDDGRMRNCRVCWNEIETQNNGLDLKKIEDALKETEAVGRCMLLTVEPIAPARYTDVKEGFMDLIGRLGERYGNNPVIFGLNVTVPENGMSVREAVTCFRKAFPNAYLFIRPALCDEQDLMSDVPGIGYTVTPENMAAFAEKAACHPLKIRLEDLPEDRTEEAIRCGISLIETEDPAEINRPCHFGHRFRAEKMMMETVEDQLRIGAVLKNVGNTGCYSDSRFLIRLNGSDVPDVRVYDTGISGRALGPGQQTEIVLDVDTEGLTPGEYDINIGLRLDWTGYPVSFGIEGRISDGFYEGRMIYVHPGSNV